MQVRSPSRRREAARNLQVAMQPEGALGVSALEYMPPPHLHHPQAGVLVNDMPTDDEEYARLKTEIRSTHDALDGSRSEASKLRDSVASETLSLDALTLAHTEKRYIPEIPGCMLLTPYRM